MNRNLLRKMSYLDGATPTRLGPRPRKSERGPSLSKINLRGKKKERLTNMLEFMLKKILVQKHHFFHRSHYIQHRKRYIFRNTQQPKTILMHHYPYPSPSSKFGHLAAILATCPVSYFQSYKTRLISTWIESPIFQKWIFYTQIWNGSWRL